MSNGFGQGIKPIVLMTNLEAVTAVKVGN